MSEAAPKKANPMVTPNAVGLTKKDYKGSPSTLCTGCGHDSITMHIVSAFYDLNISPHQVAKFSGIGCSSKTPAYFLAGSHGFNSVHGRMPSVATGASVVNRDMVNIAVSGDGDTASIGIGQFIHICRRNIPLLYIIENNGVYGLTKGQFSATADQGSVLKKGASNHFEAVDLCTMALNMGCGYVGRSFSGDVRQLLPLIKGGIKHKGLAVLDVISPCITFNNHEGSTKSYPFVKENDQILQELGFHDVQEAIEVDYEKGESKIIRLHDGSLLTLKKLERDYDPTNRKQAMEFLHEAKENGQLLTGLFYIDPDSVPFQEVESLATQPLVEMTQEQLQPSKADFDSIISALA